MQIFVDDYATINYLFCIALKDGGWVDQTSYGKFNAGTTAGLPFTGSTLLGHVMRLHFDESFVVDRLKRNFQKPICVIDNRRNGTVNAIYDIPCGGHKMLLVAVKFQGLAKRLTRKPHFIKTFYGVNEFPNGPVIWGKKL